MARTHLIVITDNGTYHRLAPTSKDPVPFIRWEDGMPKDLLDPWQQAIFKAYKMDPHSKIYPLSYHEDMAWSQEFLRKVLNGETVPRTMTVIHASGFGMYRSRLVPKHMHGSLCWLSACQCIALPGKLYPFIPDFCPKNEFA